MALSPQERSRRMRLNMLMAMSYAVAGRSTFTPLSLFAAGEQGAWYDPSDFSTMFQDSGGTTPVTAVEQPVGLIRDKSGRGNHASQTTSTSRPVLRQETDGRYYLSFDGTDDFLVTGTINPGSVDKAQVFAGVRKLSDAARGVVAEFSAGITSNAGAFVMDAPQGAVANLNFASRGTSAAVLATSGNVYAAPITNVMTGIGNISGDVTRLRVNGVQAAETLTDQGTGNYGSYPLYIGRRGGISLPFNGRLFGLIVRFSAENLPDATITNAETWMNTKTGAY